jgi:DNA-binding response OmpR family regulator
MRNVDKVLTRDQIIANVWNFDQEPYPNTVDSHISTLRRMLKDRKQQTIQTVFGIGYKLKG